MRLRRGLKLRSKVAYDRLRAGAVAKRLVLRRCLGALERLLGRVSGWKLHSAISCLSFAWRIVSILSDLRDNRSQLLS